MQRATYDRLSLGVEASRRYLRTSEALRSAIFSGKIQAAQVSAGFIGSLEEVMPSLVQWRVLDHCSAVTRLYALFEAFVADVVSDYVAHLERDYEFRTLPEQVQDRYRHGVSKLLTSIHLPRYSSVSLPDMIAQYGEALAGKPFRFEPEAFRVQEQNLRLGELSRIFSGLGITTLSAWIDQHPAVLDYFEKNSSHLNVENRLRELVQYRNDASHSGLEVDDILGPDDLDRMATFVLVMATAIRECALGSYLDRMVLTKGAVELGSPTEIFQKGACFVMPFVGACKVGEPVFVKGSRFCTEAVIESLMVEDVSVSDVDFTATAELGIKLSIAVRKNVRILRLLSEAPSEMVVEAQPESPVTLVEVPSAGALEE